jgi:hypothetical protein
MDHKGNGAEPEDIALGTAKEREPEMVRQRRERTCSISCYFGTKR